MKRVLLGLLIACLTMVFAALSAMAGQNAQAGIAFHIDKKIVNTKGWIACDNAPDFFTGGRPQGAQAFNVKEANCPGDFGEFDVWVVVCGGSEEVGIAGIEYNVEYDFATGSGVDVQVWSSCTDLQFPSAGFPYSQFSGNVQTWSDCQQQSEVTDLGGKMEVIPNTVYAVAGYMRVHVYGADEMKAAPRYVTGKLQVGSCEPVEEDLTARLESYGSATFCMNKRGYNPCYSPAGLGTESTTWGKVKTLYGN
jgi:hypothetical protein